MKITDNNWFVRANRENFDDLTTYARICGVPVYEGLVEEREKWPLMSWPLMSWTGTKINFWGPIWEGVKNRTEITPYIFRAMCQAYRLERAQQLSSEPTPQEASGPMKLTDENWSLRIQKSDYASIAACAEKKGLPLLLVPDAKFVDFTSYTYLVWDAHWPAIALFDSPRPQAISPKAFFALCDAYAAERAIQITESATSIPNETGIKTPEIEVGSVVTLASGSPKMTVCTIDDNTCNCCYFDYEKKGIAQFQGVLTACLRVYPEAGPETDEGA